MEDNKTTTTEQVTPQDDTQSKDALIEELRAELDRTKKALSKTNTEAAENKRKLIEKMSEQERLEAERAENEKAIQEELKQLRAEKRVSTYTNRLIEVGYDLDTARKMANTLPEGVGEDYFTSQKTFLENKQKQIEADVLKKQPSLTSGKPLEGDDVTKEADKRLASYFGL